HCCSTGSPLRFSQVLYVCASEPPSWQTPASALAQHARVAWRYWPRSAAPHSTKVSASLPTAANFGVSVQSTERKEDEQRKSKRDRKAESSSNDVREPVTHDVSYKTRGECPHTAALSKASKSQRSVAGS